jgi:hypothetical protein
MTLGDAGDPLVHSAADENKVVLRAPAFIKGWLIATTLWVGVLFLVVVVMYAVPTLLSGTDGGHLWGVAAMVLFYGYGIALVFGAPLAWVLAFLLRPIRNQWLHVAAFFVVPTFAFWTVAGLLGIGWHPGLLSLWATVGAAAAIGRSAIRSDVSSSTASAPEL